MRGSSLALLLLGGIGLYALSKRGAGAAPYTERQMESAIKAEELGVPSTGLMPEQVKLYEAAGVSLGLGGTYEPSGFAGLNPVDPYRIYMISPEQLKAGG